MNVTIPSELKTEYPFTGNFFQTKSGHRMHYLDEGKGHPIIMVHGNPTWSFFYRNLVKEFKSNFRIIVPDHLGMGLSDRPQNYEFTLANHIDNLTDLLNHLDIKKASLIVHDWGGPIGLGTALKAKLETTHTIIMNTAAFIDKNIPSTINFCRTPFLGEYMMRGLNAFAWPATFMAVEKPLNTNIKRGYLLPYNNFHNRIGVARFVQDIPMNDNHRSFPTLKKIEENLKSLPGKKLLLWGAKDFCFTTHFYERFKDIFPDAQTELIKEAGHYLMEDSPKKSFDTIRNFLVD